MTQDKTILKNHKSKNNSQRRLKLFSFDLGKSYLEKIQKNSKVRSDWSIVKLETTFLNLFIYFDPNIISILKYLLDNPNAESGLNKIYLYFLQQTTNLSYNEWIDIIKFLLKNKKISFDHVYFVQHICNYISRDGLEEKFSFKNFSENELEYKVKTLKKDFHLIPIDVLDNIFIKANIYMKIIIAIFMTTGIRIGALSKFKKENLDLKKGLIKTIEKGNIETEIKINSKILNLMLDNNFFNIKWTPDFIRYHLRKLFKELEINEKYLHPHAFRHTYATLLIKNSIEMNKVSQFLHHKNVQTTIDYYAKLSNFELVNATSLPFAKNVEKENIEPIVWKWCNDDIKDLPY